MLNPKVGRPYWPDSLSSASGTEGLKPWAWAEECLRLSHNYWIATSRPDGLPHLMVVWGIWWEEAFWFSTGPRTRKARNLGVHPFCVIGTDKADEAVILEGSVSEITDRNVWKRMSKVYNAKYGGDLEPILAKSGGTVFRVQPRVVFAQDEHAEDFARAVTRWTF